MAAKIVKEQTLTRVVILQDTETGHTFRVTEVYPTERFDMRYNETTKRWDIAAVATDVIDDYDH